MTLQFILAVVSLVIAIIGAWKWWLKRQATKDVEKGYENVIEHKNKVQLSIKEALKVGKRGRKVANLALSGKLSRANRNRVRSGLRAQDD